MLMRKRLFVEMCRQQRGACFLQRQAPVVARDGDETYKVRIGVEGGMVEQVSDMDALPAPGAVETAGTIQTTILY
jgi:hypothetical protein